MVVLLTGGAGYIGSHTARQLSGHGFQVIIYDNFSSGHREAVKDFPIVAGDIADADILRATLTRYRVQAVIHFAADSLVAASVTDPAKYFQNNVCKSLILLNQLVHQNVGYIILSSSAAVYGEPLVVPINEEHPLKPTNPYGDTKCMLEKILKRYHEAYGLKYVSLRYFNSAGADPGGDIGEDHEPETHLIPKVLKAALGQTEKVSVFGGDYPTKDGTAVRDYIHVKDLADAHILALNALLHGLRSTVFNLGSEEGFSVLEVLNTATKITGKSIKYEIVPRRAGDPAILVASSKKIKQELGWDPEYKTLENIIGTAWKWHRSHPCGYTTVCKGDSDG
ncbi:MAG: UDP-glucose 4-epimerase GalE [Bacillota bacterium]